jgi:hypothetical protein
MSDLVDRLLADYVAEHEAGGDADPRQYLARASGADRRELASLIDAYLARAPRQSFNEAGFRGSSAERTVDELQRALGGQSGLWPALLPRLRDRAGLKRSELVERLASALGVGDRKDKVAGYYHQMEQGLLPTQGVSDRVLAALGQIVGETEQALRDAGRTLAAAGEAAPAAPAAFARRAYTEAAGAAAPGARAPAREWDDIDELFRGPDVRLPPSRRPWS